LPLLYDPSGEPVEIAPGRGDLRYSSAAFSGYGGRRDVSMIGNRTVSYAMLFAQQIWVAAAVMRLLSGAIRVPLKAYRRTGDDSRERLAPADHPLAGALVDPWQLGPGPSSQAALVQSLLGPVLVHGNSLTNVDQGARDVIRFEPFDWRCSNPVTPVKKRIAGWTVTEDGESRSVGADTAMHIAWWSPLGPTGVSPLQQLGVTLSIEDAAQRYQQSLFRNGARPPSAVTASAEFFQGFEPDVRDQMLAQTRADINDLYVGPDRAGRPVLLPPGLDWKPVGHTAVEAELIDQRKVAREEVAAVYLLPPPMIGILDKATYSNINVQREMFYTDSLGPPLVLIEQVINAHIVRGLLRETDVFVEFDFAGVLRGDRLKEIQAIREAVGMMLLTPNEGRRVLNYASSEEPLADSLWAPWNNLRPINDPPPDGAMASGDGAQPAQQDNAAAAEADSQPVEA
jgi:HK97 family phage portal protein